jgi:serine/threonine protein kinase
VLDNQGAKSFCGSVAYLAPEMLKGTGHGKSVDWYLLGVLLYEMLVGIPPYFTNNKEKLFQNIQRGPLLIPSQLSTEAKQLIIGVSIELYN